MTRYWWAFLFLPVVAPVMWFYWDPAYYIFGGDTPNWISFANIVEWHFPYLWNEFDGAGHPFANNVPIPTALFFWAFSKLGFPILIAQMSFFVAFSALSAFGIYRIGKLYFDNESLPLFVIVASLFYLLNPFGFYGENRRIFTTEFVVAYHLLPLFVSYLLVAIENSKLNVREALLAALTSVALHNFNLVPAISYIGISYLAIALFFIIARRDKIPAIIKFFAIFLAVSFVLLAYHLYGMFQYYSVSNLASDLAGIVPAKIQSTADLLVRTLFFSGGGRNAPIEIAAYFLPLLIGIVALLRPTSTHLVWVSCVLMVVSLFMMDAGKLATNLFGLTETTSFIYAIFRFPHIKFTAPYILSVALLCGIVLARFTNKKIIVVFVSALFILIWNPRAYTTWLPIQLHRPDDWLALSDFLQSEKRDTLPPQRILKIPSIEYFKDGVGGEEFDHTPPLRATFSRPWMVHSTALGLLVPAPLFSTDMTIGARLNSCVSRIFRNESTPQETAALIKTLGIGRVLLSKKFTYLDAWTPPEYKRKMRRLVNQVQFEIPHGGTPFANDGLKLSDLTVKPLPLIYVADQVERISALTFSTCAFAQPDDGGRLAPAFYAEIAQNIVPKLAAWLPPSHASAEFKSQAPGKYLVHVTSVSAKDPIVLVLNNTYADWVVETSGGEASNGYFRDRRFPVNGFATAWILDVPTICKTSSCRINSAGEYDFDLTISYAPQAAYQLLLFSAILVFTFIVFLLTFGKIGKFPNNGPAK